MENKNKNKNKALWKHEFRKCKWFLLTGCFLACMGLITVYAECDMDMVVEMDYISETVIVSNVVRILTFASVGLFFGIPLMAAIQYTEQKVKNTGEFLHSLPVGTGVIMRTKVLAGVICITVPCMIFLAGSILIWNVCIGSVRIRYLGEGMYWQFIANDTWQNVLANVFMFWLMAIALYALSLAVQTTIKPCFVAFVVTMCTAVAPSYFMEMIARMGQNCGYVTEHLLEYSNRWNVWFGNTLAERHIGEMGTNLKVFIHPVLSVMIYLFVIVLAAGIIKIFARRQQLEDSKHFIVSRQLTYFFKGSVAGCIAVGILGIQNGITNNLMVLVVFFVILTVVIYHLLDKAIQRYE